MRGKRIALIGYGNQGRAHALNLRDSGVSVVLGIRDGSSTRGRAQADGFSPQSASQAVADAELVIVALPDEVHAATLPQLIRSMNEDAVIGFLHGFSIHFGQVTVPKNFGVVLVAPKGPGTALRERFVEGMGIPSLLAVHQGGRDLARTEAFALGWAHGIGSAHAGVIRTTFAEETETDLFGEQAVLCGGMVQLIRHAYEILVEEGYPPLLAYTECCHEVKQIADLICDRGIAGMSDAISRTARFGAVEAGPRIIDASVRARMKEVLHEIQDGSFAKRMADETQRGSPSLARDRQESTAHPMEDVGRLLRSMLPWLKRR